MENIKDSLADYVDSRIDVLKDKTQKEIKQTKALINFFQSFKRDLEVFTKGFQKSIDTLDGAITTEAEWTEIIRTALRQYTELVKALFDYTEDVDKSVLRPLQSHAEKYEQTNVGVFSSTREIISELANYRNLCNKAKARYLKKRKELVNCNTEAAYKNKLISLNEAEQEYRKLMDLSNSQMTANKTAYNSLLRTWYENEESTSKLFRGLLARYFEISNDICSICNSSNICLKKIAENGEIMMDVEKYIPTVAEKGEKLFSKIAYEMESGDAQENLLNVRLAQLFPDGLTTECFANVKEKIKELFEDESITKLEAEQILSIACTAEGLKMVHKEFTLINRKIELENEEAFNILSELGVIVLNQVSKHKFPQIKHLATLLNLGAFVAYYNPKIEGEKCKRYLRDRFIHHNIWKSKEIWLKIIQYKINKEMRKCKLYVQLRENSELDKKSRNNGLNGIVCTELTFVSFEMAFYFLSPTTSRDIILETARTSKMDNIKLYQLLVDYEAAQQVGRKEPTVKQRLECSLAKREKERKRYSQSKGTMIVGMALRFIGELDTLTTLLLVNREFYTIFKPKVHRIALTRYHEQVRFKLWKSILHSQGFESLYNKLKTTRLKDFIDNNPEIDDIIRMDVLRSFSVPSEKDQASIMDILRCYAITSPEIEYCQGMNCIAGMFYLIYKNEGTAFTMLSTLIDDFSLSNLFKEDVPLLRVYFYQLNRLIAIYLPQLHLHFFEGGINAAHFSSPWFLTVFTFVMQFCKGAAIPRLLLEIFDGFLTKGMKSLFGSSLFILKYHEERLLRLRPEEILQFLGGLATNDFFDSAEVEKAYMQVIQEFNITQKLLDKLGDEHNQICARSRDIKNVKQTEVLFRHYVPYKGKLTPVYILSLIHICRCRRIERCRSRWSPYH
eukprot:TRINITY_DN7824_c0_g1_i3.p1 TRINITY_DN7824_c0_g1~~TRINITY_DN7824_c0_g1_i3.p1  ORF type:complete len:902 (+),score=268.78 TRINITY_DN7824_c0_g1_i3:179-2884(+)